MGASAGIWTGALITIVSSDSITNGEAPVIVEADRVWHLMSPTTSSVLVGSAVPMPTLPVAVSTKRFEVPISRSADTLRVPVTFTAADEVIPAADRVPVMSVGPPTTRLAVASMLETEIVPPDNLLLTVRLDVATLVDEIVPLETILP